MFTLRQNKGISIFYVFTVIYIYFTLCSPPKHSKSSQHNTFPVRFIHTFPFFCFSSSNYISSKEELASSSCLEKLISISSSLKSYFYLFIFIVFVQLTIVQQKKKVYKKQVWDCMYSGGVIWVGFPNPNLQRKIWIRNKIKSPFSVSMLFLERKKLNALKV